MNQAIIKEIIKIFFLIFIPFIIVKALYLGLNFYFLEKRGVNYKAKNNSNFYEKFKFSKSFDLKVAKNTPKTKKIELKTEIYKLVNLKLKAVYISEGNTFIAVEEKNKTEFIDLNSEFNGYKLIEVEINRAIFEKNNKNYELIIDDSKLPEVKESDIIKDDFYTVKKDIIKKFSNNFDEIWKNISIKEIKENGEIKGFKVRYIKPKSIFNQIGLKAGDIIIAINNIELKSYADAFGIYKKISKIKNLKVTLIRDNLEKEIEYEIN